MNEWLEKIVDWQEERVYRLQRRFDLSDLQMFYIAFLTGAVIICIL